MRHPCMTFWPEKFFADTAHVSWEERGAYMILLNHAWVRGGSLPNDERQLRNMVGCGAKKWYAMREAVMAFWTLQEDGRWHQKRLDEEWRRAGDRKQSATSHLAPPGERRLAKKSMITTRARPDDPTPTQNSLPLGRESSGAPAPLSVREAHALPALRLVSNTEPSLPKPQLRRAKELDEPSVPEDEKARVAERLAELKRDLEASKALLDLEERKRL